MNVLISINGQVVHAEKAGIPLLSPGFLYGKAVYETLRTYHKEIFRLDDHLKRFKASTEAVDLPLACSDDSIKQWIVELVSESEWSELRVRLIALDLGVIIMAQELNEKPDELYQKGIRLVQFEGERTLPEVKKLGDLFSYQANQFAIKNGAYDSLLVNAEGVVRECSYANLFWVKSGQLFTNEKGVLKGITRRTVIELNQGCQFLEIAYNNLLGSDEIFITQTSSRILPVVQIDEHSIASGLPGEKTKNLMRRFNQLVWGS